MHNSVLRDPARKSASRATKLQPEKVLANIIRSLIETALHHVKAKVLPAPFQRLTL